MVNWYKEDSKFYGMTTSSVSNRETVQFESGKPRDFLKDSTSRKIHSVSFRIVSMDEELFFWDWYDNILLSGTQTIKMKDFLNPEGFKEYRMADEPQTNDAQFPKEFSVTFEEV